MAKEWNAYFVQKCAHFSIMRRADLLGHGILKKLGWHDFQLTIKKVDKKHGNFLSVKVYLAK